MKLEISMELISNSKIDKKFKEELIKDLKQLDKYRERVRNQVARSRANKKDMKEGN